MKQFTVIDVKRGKTCQVEAVDYEQALLTVHLELYGFLATEKASIVYGETAIMIGKNTPTLAIYYEHPVLYKTMQGDTVLCN